MGLSMFPPDLTIWDRLAWIDPANSEQQRCVHGDWHWAGIYAARCRKCHYQYVWAYGEQYAPPLVGDGRNEERYNSLDALLRLAPDLGLTVQITHFARGGLGRTLVKAWPQGKQEAGARVRDTLPAVALAHAIVKAYPGGVCEIPEGGKEVRADG